MSATNRTYRVKLEGRSAELSKRERQVLRLILSGITYAGECWLASGSPLPSGYVRLTVANPKNIGYTHRFVAHYFCGLPLDEEWECHHLCDTKGCCRPSHLTPLTIAEHKAQTHADGRHPHGDAAHWAVLTEDQVRSMRLRYAAGETCPSLAKEAGVQRSTMYSALHGQTFSHVPGAVTQNDRRDWRGEKHKRAKLKEQDIPAIYTAYWIGEMSTLQLGRIYGISDETVRKIIHDKTWTHVKRPALERAA